MQAKVSSVEMARGTASVASLAEVKSAIWGPLYPLAQLTGLIVPIDPHKSRSKKAFCHALPNVFIGLLLLVNTLYSLTKMMGVSLSINWAYSECIFFMALHGVVCVTNMTLFKFSNYFNNVASMLKSASKNKMAVLQERRLLSKLLKFVQIALIVGSMGVYCADTFIQFDKFVTTPRAHNVSRNDTQEFRKSMFMSQQLFCVDTLIKVYAAFVSALCLTLYTSANEALCLEFGQFNQHLRESINDKSILRAGTLESFQEQLLQFLATARYLTENAVGVLAISFVSGIFIWFYAIFAARSFQEYLSFGLATFGLWVVVSVILMFAALVTSAGFYKLLQETKNMLNLSPEIWVEAKDVHVHAAAKNLINNINNQDYGYKNMLPIKPGLVMFNLVLMAMPFIGDPLSRAKYVPAFIEALANN